MTPTTKKISKFSIKYMPTVLCLTASAKIWLTCMSDTQKDSYLLAVNWINIVFCMLILGATYMLGKAFGYCWKHQSLCRTAFWGYVFYTFFLLLDVPKSAVLPIVTLYFITTVVLTLLYKEVK